MNPHQDLFHEIDAHLLHDAEPSVYLRQISGEPVFLEYPFNLLKREAETEQNPKHHPEGNVLNHTLMVVDEAAKVKEKSRDARAFMWAALLHDIGKPDTTRVIKGRITAYDHDKAGARLAGDFLAEFTEDFIFIGKVTTLTRWHMQLLHVVKDNPFADIPGMKHDIDPAEIALFGLCDRMGRTNADRKKEEKNIELFLKKTK